jgi:hypothetical protein
MPTMPLADPPVCANCGRPITAIGTNQDDRPIWRHVGHRWNRLFPARCRAGSYLGHDLAYPSSKYGPTTPSPWNDDLPPEWTARPLIRGKQPKYTEWPVPVPWPVRRIADPSD